MKTTVEIPDALFREAKAAAAGRGISLKSFLNEAIKEKLAEPRHRRSGWLVPPAKVARDELERVASIIDGEFSRIEEENWK